MKKNHPLQIKNRKKDLWLYDNKGNCYYFPQGWVDDFDMGEGSELYGYYPTKVTANSEIDTGYVECKSLKGYKEVTKEEAQQLHPELIRHLNRIDFEGKDAFFVMNRAVKERKISSAKMISRLCDYIDTITEGNKEALVDLWDELTYSNASSV